MADDTTSEDLPIVVDDDLKNAQDLIAKAWKILDSDRGALTNIDDYVRGKQPGPYTPRGASTEYKLLIKRAQSNWLPLVLAAPAQSLYVEGYRGGASVVDDEDNSLSAKAWSIWQRNRLDARQAAIYRSALQFGVAYVVVEKPPTGDQNGDQRQAGDPFPVVRALSALRTTALWFDPANDERPEFVITVDVLPDNGGTGHGRAWDNESVYQFDLKDDGTVESLTHTPHGFDRCPVVPFSVFRDLEGRFTGIIEHLLPIQDRINQTLFDMLIAQTYGSFKVRWAAGLTPPPKRQAVTVTVGEVRNQLPADHPLRNAPDDTVYGTRMEVVLDENGNPVPDAVTVDATRFLVFQDEDTKVGQLDETPLDGFIESISMSVHHLAAIAQVPPHHLLGDMANLSADALAVAESSLFRMVAELQHSFGESWEQVMGLLLEAMGSDAQALAEGEVMWRDMSANSFAALADGLSKLADSLQIPHKGLWKRVPGVTRAELDEWEELASQQQMDGTGSPQAGLTRALDRATTTVARPTADVIPNAH